jgi:hypothetical protein
VGGNASGIELDVQRSLWSASRRGASHIIHCDMEPMELVCRGPNAEEARRMLAGGVVVVHEVEEAPPCPWGSGDARNA